MKFCAFEFGCWRPVFLFVHLIDFDYVFPWFFIFLVVLHCCFHIKSSRKFSNLCNLPSGWICYLLVLFYLGFSLTLYGYNSILLTPSYDIFLKLLCLLWFLKLTRLVSRNLSFFFFHSSRLCFSPWSQNLSILSEILRLLESSFSPSHSGAHLKSQPQIWGKCRFST